MPLAVIVLLMYHLFVNCTIGKILLMKHNLWSVQTLPGMLDHQVILVASKHRLSSFS